MAPAYAISQKPPQNGHVFVVSEWLPKEGCDEKLWLFFKELMAVTKEKEAGCVRAHATRDALYKHRFERLQLFGEERAVFLGEQEVVDAVERG